MEDDWDNVDFSAPVKTSTFAEEGRSYGKGRGFKPLNNNNEEQKVGSKNGFKGTDDNACGFDAFKDDNAEWDEGTGNRGGGGDRRGRGGRGGFRSRNDDDGGNDFGRKKRYGDDDDDDNEGFNSGGSRGGRGRRGGGRGGGRGGFRGRNDDDGENNFGRNRRADNDNDDEGFGAGDRRRGGGGSRGRSDDKPEPVNKEIYIPPEPSNEETEIYGSGVAMGINFDKYDDIKINVTGENPPKPIETFEEIGLRAFVLENIKKSGYKKPTPVQKYALPIVIAGRDLMACAQTGSGKTAAFMVPIINTLLEHPQDLIVTSSYTEPQVVVVSPTRELAIQIYEQARKFSRGSILKCVVVYGGTSVMYQANQVAQGCHILVGTPGRLNDFIGRGRVKLNSIRSFILDEADRMLDMGFLPEVEKILDHETMLPCGERQTLMFSATFPEEIQRLAGRFLKNYLFLAVGIVGGACSDVEQKFYEVTKYQKRAKLKELMEKESDIKSQRTLVFVEMKRTADFIAAFLSENNYPTTSIHGDRMQREREEALSDFKRGIRTILVATAVAARGLDIKGVGHVINYDLPKSIDDYVHRIGRTGRVGNCGRATSFFDPEDDGPLTSDLIKILQQAGQPIPDWLGSGGGSGGRSFAPGRSSQFQGRDIRNFNKETSSEPYPESAYTAPAPDSEEEW